MRSITVLLLISIYFTSCKEKAEKYFEVTGSVKNNNARIVYLEETPVASMQRIVLDSALINKNGSFSLKARTKEESLFNLRLDAEVYPFVSLINDTKKITVNADFSNMKDFYTVKGSPASQTIKDYLFTSGTKFRNIYNVKVQLDSLAKNNTADSIIQPLQARETQLVNEIKDYTSKFLHSSNSPVVSMFVLGSFQSTSNQLQMSGYKDEEVGNIINDVVKKFPAHQGVASIKKTFDAQAAKNQGLLGRPAPEIALQDPAGKEVKLSSFKGKYVLVDFWASWCQPCRMENPNVVKAYNKYRDKNFAVLGVSLDEKKEAWLKAIKDDHLAWTHISDLKYWSSIVVPLYNIEGIPYNVLIDPAGKVIAENLKGPELDSKLQEVLQ